MAERS
jgi:hypothetical protein